MQRNFWVKVLVGGLLVIGVPWLFLRTIQNTIAEPYSVDAVALTGWTLHIHETHAPGPALITLVPSNRLVPQLFSRCFVGRWNR